jgi:chromosome segregation ATPase
MGGAGYTSRNFAHPFRRSSTHPPAYALVRVTLCRPYSHRGHAQLEKKLILLFKDSGDLDFPDEDWTFEVCPELNDLEADTLDALLAQAAQHARYERAARALLLAERAKIEEAHERDLRSVRAQLETDMQRRAAGHEAKLRGLEEGAQEDLEELRTEAQEKITELEAQIEELEEKNAAQERRLAEMQAEAEEEVERLRDEGNAMRQLLDEAQEETDLKRQASRKLKEEIIDNDRLTVANLNRIKLLESTLEQHKAALAESEEENEALKAELGKSVQLGKDSEEQEEEISELRALLAERESQLISMSARLSDREAISSARDPYYGGANENRRRDSFMDRLPFKPFSSNA